MQYKPKVLICVRRLDRGGAEMLETRLAVELNKLGIEADLIGQYSEDAFEGERYGNLWKSKGIKKVFWLQSDKLGFLRSLRRLKGIIKAGNYNVVITHNNGLDIYAGLCKLTLDIKHILAFHDYFYKNKINPIKFNTWKFFVKRADDFYTITDKVRNNVTDLFGTKPGKGVTVYNSIDFEQNPQTPESIRQKFAIPNNKKIVVSIGRVHPNKGFDLALKYVAGLPNVEYFIIGGFEDEQYVEQLKLDARDLGISNRVHILGFCSNAFEILSQADLFVHLARHEGFGLVIVEAIAAGVPIVSSNAGGIPEILQQTAYKTFSLEQPELINSEIHRYLDMDKGELQGIVDTAKSILPYYTDKRRATEVKAIIEKVCAE